MSPQFKNLKTLHEDEIISLLLKAQLESCLDFSVIDELISLGFNSKNKDFRYYVIDYFKTDIDRFIKSLCKWSFANIIKPSANRNITIEKCEVDGPRNFIEESLVRLCPNELNRLIDLLDSKIYSIRLSSLRSLIFIMDRDRDKIFKEDFNSYINNIIDFCIKFFEDKAIRLDVAKFLGKVNTGDSIAMLEYFRDNEEDFTIKMVSIMGLENIQKMNRSKINKNNSDIKKIILGYRR